MKNKLVMDSAGDLQVFEGMAFACAPLKITTEDREFVDNQDGDVMEMVRYFQRYSGKATSTCPSVGEFLEAFGEAENVYCVTITSHLSGSYNAAIQAAALFKERYPTHNIHVFDSLATGPTMVLMAEKIRELTAQDLPFEEVVRQTEAYHKSTRLIFALASLRNLANNGRVPVAVAKLAGVLGIRLIATASAPGKEGTITPIGKARGEKRIVPELIKQMQSDGYKGGKVCLSHCGNLPLAETMRNAIWARFPDAVIDIHTLGMLCSFYAEYGGLLVAFEV